jgi:hypothetical protein
MARLLFPVSRQSETKSSGSNPTGPTGGNGNPTGPNGGSASGNTKGTGSTGAGKTSGTKGSKGGSKPVGETGASKYLQTHKATTASGPNSFLRADQLREAATSALGFASPAVQITVWCLVLVAAIALPVLALGRRRRRGRADPAVESGGRP